MRSERRRARSTPRPDQRRADVGRRHELLSPLALGSTRPAPVATARRTEIDDPSSYLEASATAGFAYGILKAVRKGYLDAEYAPVAEKAVRAITANVSADGELQQVSFGTGMGSDLDFYRQIPRTSMPYGQAMAILCLAVYLHTYY